MRNQYPNNDLQQERARRSAAAKLSHERKRAAALAHLQKLRDAAP